LKDFDPSLLNNKKMSIFLMATHGEGEPTDNAVNFMKWLKSDERTNNEISSLNFTVFGLGNT
jgi:NADPH-ferrihemoprotein reductase